jgi:hypothetical protein
LAPTDDFKIELAAMIDLGKPLVKATYRLEGDGFLAPFAYDIIQSVLAAPRFIQYPNLTAVVTAMHLGQAAQNQLITDTLGKIMPAYDYLQDVYQTDASLSEALDIFKALRWLNPTCASVVLNPLTFEDDIRSTHLLLDHEIRVLLGEFSTYMSLATQMSKVSTEYTLFQFFVTNKQELPAFHLLATRAALMNPSSAMCERVFALFESLFKDNQHGMLSDYLSAAVMIRYNTNWRNKYQK